MHYKFEKCTEEHVMSIDPRAEQLDDVLFIRRHPSLVKRFTDEAMTLVCDGSPIAIIAITPLGFGSYMPIMITSRLAIKYKLSVVKCIYEYFERYVPIDVKRVEALVNVSDTTALRFVKLFGFDIIGIKHCSSRTGEDQIIVERMIRKSWQ